MYVFFILLLIVRQRNQLPFTQVGVFVMGDVGRSPRMQYHALSLANTKFQRSESHPKQDCQVHLVGLRGSIPHPLILEHPNIKINYVPEFNEENFILSRFGLLGNFNTHLPGRLSNLWMLFLKVIFQIDSVFQVLYDLPALHLILVQNPPGVPILLILKLYSYFVGATVVVDWHNFGYSLFRLGNLGRRFPLIVSILKHLEHFSGILANGHLCVTNAMKRFLKEKWYISAIS